MSDVIKWYSVVYFHSKYSIPSISSLFLSEVELGSYLVWMKENGYRVVKYCETDELVKKLQAI